MTLLNTLTNLGGTWPKLIALTLVDYLTLSTPCDPAAADAAACRPRVWLDGYYALTVVCLSIGAVYFVFLKRIVLRLDALPATEWLCKL